MRFAPLLLLLIACQPVREDRTIEFSGDGREVGFQHGEDGVYVADGDGRTLRKIHDPATEVIATSTPLYAPNDRRLIFTTARPIGDAAPPSPLGVFDPAGALHQEVPVLYTCWLRRPGGDGPAPEPEVLFRARCGHVGYVAANLAVRWHPSGEAVVFIDEDGRDAHGVFRFDLEDGRRTRVFPDKAENVVFDFAPDGGLVCVTPEGVHVQAGDGWWVVPAGVVAEEAAEKIEALRMRRPAFAPGGERFALASRAADKEYVLALATVADRGVTTIASAPQPFRDLRWSPDGKTLGVVQGRILRFWKGGLLSSGVGERAVRRFAGWNATGERFAFTSPEGVRAPRELWSFLLAPDPRARDALYVGGQRVFSGMRVTFPRWSPTEDKLSVWFTFSSTHRSLLGAIVGVGLRPGDPAAIFDPKTGAIEWMAVNSHEREQIGHYHLLRGENAKALEWYGRAAQDREPVERDELAVLVRGGRPHDIELFESICLARLGREAEAARKRAAFDRRFERTEATPFLDGFLALLVRDMYVAEVYLGLDDAKAGEADVRKAVAAREGAARTASLLVLGQQLLLQERHSEYADLMTDELLAALEGRPAAFDQTFVVPIALLPLASPEFLKTLPKEERAALVARWRALRPRDAHMSRMLAHFRLAAGDDVELPETGTAGARWFDDPAEVIRSLRELLTAPDLLRALAALGAGR